MISITVQSSEGTVLAYAEHPEEAWLSVDRVYQPGDVIRVTGPARLRVQMDQAIPAGEVFLPSGAMTWPVPAGEHRLAYAPGTFEAPRHIIFAARHIIFAAAVPDSGLHRIRNLALNPADLRGDTDFYPHCTANVETRNEACFCARNVIDGLRLNSFHGEWPFQSWGIGAREDAWCELDFGRPVLSDGTDLSFSLRKTADRQWIDLGGRTVSRLRLERLVKSDDPSAFPALRQWEVFGREQA